MIGCSIKEKGALHDGPDSWKKGQCHHLRIAEQNMEIPQPLIDLI